MAYHGLFMGINNYPGTENDLSGCVNDAKDLSAFFGKMSQLAQNTVLLDKQVTKKVMCRNIRTTLQACEPGDTAIITFSGHGTWVPDRNGDEPDGREECFVPYDHQRYLLPDDEVKKYLVRYRQEGSQVLLLTDCCHSGTIFRMFGPPRNQIRPRFMPPAQIMEAVRGHVSDTDEREMQRLTMQIRQATDAALPGVIHISGCRDIEYSYDAVFNGRANGAMTYMVLQAYKEVLKQSQPTYRKLYDRLMRKLPTYDYPQTPQLNATATDANLPLPQ